MKSEELFPSIKAAVVSYDNGTFELTVVTDRLRTHRVSAAVLSSIASQATQGLALALTKVHSNYNGANFHDVTSTRDCRATPAGNKGQDHTLGAPQEVG